MSKQNALVIVVALGAVLLAGVAAATQVPNSAAVFERVFNDCPFSTVESTNNYPTTVEITDTKESCGSGFANRHAWRFSQDGTTAQEFSNNDGFRFSCDLTISGDGEAEAGIGISPWWSQLVDGVFNFRTTDGEIACFGGRLPFYSFTGSQGVTYVKGTTVHVTMSYLPHGLEESNPATIEYTLDNGTLYTSGPLPFDQGNPAEPYGLWGMLNEATAGGNFQMFLQQGGPNASVTVNWSNIMFEDLGTVATESSTWGGVKSLFN